MISRLFAIVLATAFTWLSAEAGRPVKIINRTSFDLQVAHTETVDSRDPDARYSARGWEYISAAVNPDGVPREMSDEECRNSYYCKIFTIPSMQVDFFVKTDDGARFWKGDGSNGGHRRRNWYDCMSSSPQHFWISWSWDNDGNAVGCPEYSYRVRTTALPKYAENGDMVPGSDIWAIEESQATLVSWGSGGNPFGGFSPQEKSEFDKKLDAARDRNNQLNERRERCRYPEMDVIGEKDLNNIDSNEIGSFGSCMDDASKLEKEKEEAKALLRKLITDQVEVLRDFYNATWSVITSSLQEAAQSAHAVFESYGLSDLIAPAVYASAGEEGFHGKIAQRYLEAIHLDDRSAYFANVVTSAAWSTTFAGMGDGLLAQGQIKSEPMLAYLDSVHKIEGIIRGQVDPSRAIDPSPEFQRAIEVLRTYDLGRTNKILENANKWPYEALKTVGQGLIIFAEMWSTYTSMAKHLEQKERLQAKTQLDYIFDVMVNTSSDAGKFLLPLEEARKLATGFEDEKTKEALTAEGYAVNAILLGIGIFPLGKIFDWSKSVLAKLPNLRKAGRTAEAVGVAEKVVASAKKWDSVESLLHVVKGNYQIAADGTRKLVSGMHTKTGFDNFLNLNRQSGKNFKLRDVAEFTAERIEAGGDILSQTLNNGVRRVQLPRDAWANGTAFNGANFLVSDTLRLKGVKTLWPESFDLHKIGDITTTIIEANPAVRNDVIKATLAGIKVNVRVDEAGKVITSFPAWIQ